MAARILPSPDPSGGNRSTKASNKLPGLTSEAMAADLKALRQQVEAVEKSRMDWRLADAMSQNMTLAMKKLKLELHGTVQATLQERNEQIAKLSDELSHAQEEILRLRTECDAKHATAHSDRDAAAARAAAEEEEARRHKAEVEAIKAAADEAAIAAAAAAGILREVEKAERAERRGVCCLERRKRRPYRCSSAYWRPRSAPTLQWRG